MDLYDGMHCLVSFLLLIVGCQGYVRVCYYPNWAQFRAVPARFVPEDVDPFLCTHIVFAFAGIEGTDIQPTEYNDEEMYSRLVSLKTTNPDLRILLSVGGWLAGGARFSQLVSSGDSMQRFVGDAIQYLRRHRLDGLDVDWEFPASVERGSQPDDRVRFTRLLQLLREEFEREATQRGEERLLLTIAAVPDVSEARQYYQIPQIARSVDYIHLMAYDFHGQWDLSEGARHHSALYPEVHDSVEGWLQEGAPPGKLVLGIPAFGRLFVLAARPRGDGVGQAATAVSDLGDSGDSSAVGSFVDDGGLLTYQEVCELLGRGGWQREWLRDQQAPVALGNISGGDWWGWAGYDDVNSITAKADYVKERSLAGVMLWSMPNDDFNNQCAQGAWPLLTSLSNQLPQQPAVGPEIPPTSSTTTTTTTTKIVAPASTSRPHNRTRWLPPRAPSRPPPPGRRTTGAHPREGVPSTSVSTTLAPGRPESRAGYRQCRISDNFGPSLRCPSHHGKRGFRNTFYLFCFNGFFAIECSCLPGFFYNRCLQTCDADSNFFACPFVY